MSDVLDLVDRVLADFHPIGDDQFAFAVPLHSPPDLQKYMFGAYKTYYSQTRFGSSDTVEDVIASAEDTWGFDEESRSNLQVAVDQMALGARDGYERSLSKVIPAPRESSPSTFGRFVARSVLYRLNSTVTLATLLARFGYGAEGATLQRLAIEQIAWAYRIRNYEDKKALSLTSTGHIGNLRHLIPWVGRIYGWLSDWTHIKPDLTKEYIEVTESGFSRLYMRRPETWSRQLAWSLLAVVDAIGIVCEAIFYEELTTLRYLKPTESDTFDIQAKRPLTKLLTHYESVGPFPVEI